jgi:hypothetical protein
MKTIEWSVKLDPRTKDAIEAAKLEYPSFTSKSLVEAMAVTMVRLLAQDPSFALDRPFWHETPKPNTPASVSK